MQDSDEESNDEYELLVNVLEAMCDMAKKTDILAHVSKVRSPQQGKQRNKPDRRMMAHIMGFLFTQPAATVNDDESEAPALPPGTKRRMR